MKTNGLTIFLDDQLRTRAGRQQLYVVAYMFLFGLPLLVFPNTGIPFLDFVPTVEVWVWITGMFLLGLTMISIGIFRSPTAECEARL
jgi:hypothetical protein